MGYFRELPDLEYQSFLSDALSSRDYLKVKNLFRRNKLRDDLQNSFTLFNKYKIKEGARPDNVAEEFYGSADLDWVVLITAGIINVRNDWPLSNYQLYKYVEKKYGLEDLNSVHHYETVEIKTTDDNIILPKGKVVDSDFVFNYVENGVKVTKSGTKVRTGVTNYEYEVLENEKKSSIYLLRRGYLQQFLNDMREIMTYGLSSEYVNESVIRTENTKVTSP
tara:strand:+ start:552 stop:1214 length:663 start_codon:yes stop_codon:yes gene_type:complete